MIVGSVGEIEPVTRTGAETWVEVGRVAKAAGVDGALLIHLHGNDPANLIAAEQLTLRGRPGSIPFRVDRAEAFSSLADGRARARVRLAGLTSRERAEVWAGAGVLIPETALAALPEGEFYWRDLIGLRVRTLDGRELGRVEEIWPTASNDVLVVHGGAEMLLVPALRSVLVRVDLPAGEICIDPPPGLLPEDA